MNTQAFNTAKRQRIIKTAIDLFRDSPKIRKVSIEEIAARARVSPTTIYHYFGTREALVAEVAKELVHTIVARSREFLGTQMPLAQKLQAIASVKLQLVSVLGDEVISKMVGQDPAMAEFVESIFNTELAPLWHDFLVQGKAEGLIDPDLDEAVFMAYLDVLIAGFRSKSDLLRQWVNNRKALEQLSRLVFYGFMKKDVDLFAQVPDDTRHVRRQRRTKESGK